MGEIEWGAEPEFFGPRHAHREGRILAKLRTSWARAEPHLDCAAGVGSLAIAIARHGRPVAAADTSLRSLAVMRRRAKASRVQHLVLPVLADATRLPFPEGVFETISSAETLEHIPEHQLAVAELARTLRPGGRLVGTVPADPRQWSDWDEWAGHLRRYTHSNLKDLLGRAGLEAEVQTWGWPFLRLYDALFLGRVNRRRLRTDGPAEHEPTLRRVAALGRCRWLVGLVRAVLELDRVFDGCRWGVGLLFIGRRPVEISGNTRDAEGVSHSGGKPGQTR